MTSPEFAVAVSRLENVLARCVRVPGVGPIHHARTGSRRLDAALDMLNLETAENESLCKSVAELRKLLKKVRHRAGKARDIDVHRKLLRKLANSEEAVADTTIRQQIAALDVKLKQRRDKAAGKLQQRAAKWCDRLKRQSNAILESMQQAGDSPAREPAAMALDSFAMLCREIPVLDAGTLHAFRKGAKHARYIAEAGDGEWARQTAKRLKQIQDAIGLWHDWLTLAEEARAAADGQENELVSHAERMRDRHFESALQATLQARKYLLAERETQAPAKKKIASVNHDDRKKKYA